MKTSPKLLERTILILSMITNVVLVFCLMFFLLTKNPNHVTERDKYLSQNIIKKEMAEYLSLGERSHAIESNNETHISNQFFYGTWKVAELISPDFSLPSSYSGLNKDSTSRGPELSSIIGMEITFSVSRISNSEDKTKLDINYYIEYSGEKHELVYGPKTYSYSLLSENDRIGYYEAKTLGIEGNYYSTVFFLLPDNWMLTGETRKKEMRINDLCYLYLRDNNTIYASDGSVFYLLKRDGGRQGDGSLSRQEEKKNDILAFK